MSNRFTDSEKWSDPWFCGLTPAYKLFWNYLCDNCSHAGIWKVNWALVKFHIWEETLDPTLFGSRLVILSNEKWFIKGFVLFQQKIKTLEELNPDNNAHRSILKELDRENVISRCNITIEPLASPLLAPSKPLARGPGKVMVRYSKGKETIIENKVNRESGITQVFDHFCLKLSKKLILSPERAKIIEQRLKEGRSIEDMKTAIDNFSKDTWEDRHKFCDIVYVLGVRNKVNNLDKWLLSQDKTGGGMCRKLT